MNKQGFMVYLNPSHKGHKEYATSALILEINIHKSKLLLTAAAKENLRAKAGIIKIQYDLKRN